MQDQIHKFNLIANSTEYEDEIREYAKSLSKFLWSFEKANKSMQAARNEMDKLLY